MTKPGWGAIVQGEPIDLEGWAHSLNQPFDPWVEVHDEQTVLRSASFDELASADEVRDRALAYIDRLNGAMALWQQTSPLRFGGVIQFAADGKRHRTVFAEMGAYEVRGDIARFYATVTGPDGKPVPPPPPQPSEVQRWAKIADANDLLDDALMYFAKGADWFDIYKALECLFQNAGGEPAFLKLNWEPKKEVERLRYTANWYRHARRRNALHEIQPMSLNDARTLLGKLLRRALHEAQT